MKPKKLVQKSGKVMQMTPEECDILRAKLLDMIKKSPSSCAQMAEVLKMNHKSLMNHLSILRKRGLIHCIREGKSSNLPFIWVSGYGESVVRFQPKRLRKDEQDEDDITVNQRLVKTWEPASIKPQNIFSALGL